MIPRSSSMKNREDTVSAALSSGDAILAAASPAAFKQFPVEGARQAPAPLQTFIKEHVVATEEQSPPFPSAPRLPRGFTGQQHHSQGAHNNQVIPQMGVTGPQPKATCLQAQELYTSVRRGSDETGEGTRILPFKTLLRARRQVRYGPSPSFYVDGKEEGQEYELASQTTLKKLNKAWMLESRKTKSNAKKLDEKSLQEKEDADKRAKNIEEAMKISIAEDPSKPDAQESRIIRLESLRGQRVMLFGWVHRLRRQGKALMFITLRDGSGFLQCVLSGQLCQTYDAPTLSRECSVQLFGSLKLVSGLQYAPGGYELDVDYWKLIGRAPVGGISGVVQESSDPDVQLNQRPLMTRDDKISKVLEVLSVIKAAFKDHYASHDYKRVYPPTLVQKKVKDGETGFQLEYFEKPAFPIPSSHFYLETVIPTFGDVYSMKKSFRVEKSNTKTHLSEFLHFEAECAFIFSLVELMNRIENLVVDVSERVMASSSADLVRELNPGFRVHKKPFREMTYSDGIIFLKENGITKEDGSFYEFGEAISEKAKRKMVDTIKEPILLSCSPADIKAFYMKKCLDDIRLVESVDLLLPGVGKVLGGSLRIEDEQELIAAFKKAGIDPAPYKRYIDMRRFGSCSHGGYVLEFQRFFAWVLNFKNVRKASLYSQCLELEGCSS